MFTPNTKTLVVTLFLAVSLFVGAAKIRSRFTARSTHVQPAPTALAASEIGPKEGYGKLPMAFEVNRGQTDAKVKYLARGAGYSLFLTPNEAVLALSTASRANAIEGQEEGNGKSLRAAADVNGTARSVLRMKVLGADPQAVVSGDRQLPGRSNYFIGQDQRQWRQTYTVKSGDNLSKISKEMYGDPNEYMRIFYANRNILKDPDKIQVGQQLVIPANS